eukprot:6182486-Pleurochrysis_carterae.AAC.2
MSSAPEPPKGSTRSNASASLIVIGREEARARAEERFSARDAKVRGGVEVCALHARKRAQRYVRARTAIHTRAAHVDVQVCTWGRAQPPARTRVHTCPPWARARARSRASTRGHTRRHKLRAHARAHTAPARSVCARAHAQARSDTHSFARAPARAPARASARRELDV